MDRLRALITAVGLPVSLSALPSTGDAPQWSVLRAAMTVDKKRDASGLRLVLPERIGSVTLVPAPDLRTLGSFLDRAGEST